MPLYEVNFRRSAERELGRLEPALQRRVLRATDRLAEEPRPDGCRKLQGGTDAYRIRVGNYRIIYTVDDAVLVVAIERIGHRRDIYR